MFEHKNKLIKGFSSKYNLDTLIYSESYQFVKDAIIREKNLKKWKRDWKINLIVEDNADWIDLSDDWFD